MIEEPSEGKMIAGKIIGTLADLRVIISRTIILPGTSLSAAGPGLDGLRALVALSPERSFAPFHSAQDDSVGGWGLVRNAGQAAYFRGAGPRVAGSMRTTWRAPSLRRQFNSGDTINTVRPDGCGEGEGSMQSFFRQGVRADWVARRWGMWRGVGSRQTLTTAALG